MSQLPDPYKRLSTEFNRLREEVRQLRNRSPFYSTGMEVVAPDTTIFAPALISADAVAGASVPGVAGIEGVNFAVSSTLTEVVGIDLLVPTSCTELLIHATGCVFASDAASLTPDALWSAVQIGATASTPIGAPWAAGGLATSSSALATSVGGLTPGNTVRLSLLASSSVDAHAADPGNVAQLATALTWRQ